MALREDQIPIAEDVLKAAAGNERNGKIAITLLLESCGG
jgi:hypothetical protein